MGTTQENYDNALLVNAYTNAGLGILFLLCFEVIRKKLPRIYEPRVSEGGINPSPLPFGWLTAALKYSDEMLFVTHGLDAVMHLKYLRMIAFIVFAQLLYGASVLFAINATASNQDLPPDDPYYTSGSGILSMANIPRGSNLFIAHTISVVFNSLVTYYLLHRTFQEYIRYRVWYLRQHIASNYTVMLHEVPEKTTVKQIEDMMEQIYPGKVIRVYRVENVPAIIKKLEYREKLLSQLERAEYVMGSTGKRPTMKTKSLKNYDTIQFLKEELNKVHAFVSDRQSSNRKFTNVVFVTFSTISAATTCAQSIIHEDPNHFFSSPSPESSDLIWPNLHISQRKRTVRSVLINLFVVFLIFFWTIPVSFVASLSNLQTLSTIPGLHFLVSVIDWNVTLRGFVEGFLPSLALVVFMLLLVPILRFVTKRQGFFTHSQELKSVMSKYFTFQIINVFLTMLIANSVFTLLSEIEHYVSDLGDLVRVLATSIPPQANFFMNYVLISTITVYTMSLWRPLDAIIYYIKKRFFVRTQRELDTLHQLEEFQYPVTYGNTLLIFIIVLTYSSIAPLILPFGALYCALAYATTRYNLIYVYKSSYESGGKIFPSIINRICFGVVLYQVTLGGVFSINLYPIGATISFLLVFVTLLFWYQLMNHYKKYSLYCPLELCAAPQPSVDKRVSVESKSEIFQSCVQLFTHPAMKPLRVGYVEKILDDVEENIRETDRLVTN